MTGHELAFDTTDDGTVARCSCAAFEECHLDDGDAHFAGARHLAQQCMAALRSIDVQLRALTERHADLLGDRQLVLDELLAVLGVFGAEVRVGSGR